MMQGAALVSLQRSPESLTSLVQHPSPRFEHPDPPHLPQLSGQHTSAASYPGSPLEQVWSVRWCREAGKWKPAHLAQRLDHRPPGCVYSRDTTLATSICHFGLCSPSTTISPSILQGAALVSLQRSPDSLTSLVQHPSPSFEHPDPPHLPQLRGQHTSAASYPGSPLEQVWPVRWCREVRKLQLV